MKKWENKVHESAIIRFIVLIFTKFLEIYNDSLLEKLIGSVCGFFKKRSANSRICKLFVTKPGEGRIFRSSIFYKLITTPVLWVKKASYIIGNKISDMVFKSEILKLLSMLEHISIRYVIVAVLVLLVVLMIAAAVLPYSAMLTLCCVVASVIAAVGVLMILKNTLLGIYLTVFLAPIVPTMVCVGLSGLCAVSFVLNMATQKNRHYTITAIGTMLIAFVGLAAISTVTSIHREKSMQILMLYIAFAVFYFVMVNTVRTKQQWYNLVMFFILSATAVALFGVYQNFALETTSQSSWVDEEMFSQIGVRVYSTLDNPNVLGQFLVLVIPVAFAMLVSEKKLIKRLIFFASCVIMGACLVFTWSRAGWVAIILALGFFVVMKDRRWSTLCIVALLIMPFILPENIISRITSIGNMKDSSTAYRVSVWIASLRIAADYWLGGIGLGSGAFERMYQHYALNGAGFALHSHNFYIQLVVEMGILGLVVFFAIIFASYKQIVFIKDKKSANYNVALAIGGALLGYLFQGVAENLWYNYRMVLIFFICLAILQSSAIISKGETL